MNKLIVIYDWMENLNLYFYLFRNVSFYLII